MLYCFSYQNPVNPQEVKNKDERERWESRGIDSNGLLLLFSEVILEALHLRASKFWCITGMHLRQIACVRMKTWQAWSDLMLLNIQDFIGI